MSADISNFVATKRDMIERLVVIDSVDPVIFYGVNNSNMQLRRYVFFKPFRRLYFSADASSTPISLTLPLSGWNTT